MVKFQADGAYSGGAYKKMRAVVVWYVVIWFVLYLTSVFDLILGFLGFVSMNDTDIPWTGDLSCQVSKIQALVC